MKKVSKEIRDNLRPEFQYMSDKEINDILRFFANIKNQLKKKGEDKDLCVISLKNKIITLKNIFTNEFIKKRLRKGIPQELHPELNSLLLENKILGFREDIPFDVEFYKKLIEAK